MGGQSKSEAFVTLATNDTYCQGAIVLAHSLRCHNTQRDIVIMITPQVSDEARISLQEYFDDIILVNILDSKDATHLAMLKRPELGITFTKIHCWDLTQYEKCVFMDADTMVLTNIDELFEREELSAAADSGWPDMFNSGVFVYKPSKQTYRDLINLAESTGSFDGGDQGLLNTYFSDWRTSDINKHLSFLYNMHSTSTYTYSPAFARFGKDTKVVHFIGQVKPWHHKYDSYTGNIEQAQGPGIHEMKFLKQWWNLFSDTSIFKNKIAQTNGHNLPTVPDQPMASSEQHANDPPASEEVSPEELERLKIKEQRAHLESWKSSQVDYTGADSFNNIQAKLDAVLQPDAPSTEDENKKEIQIVISQTSTSSTTNYPEADPEIEDKNKEPKKDIVGYQRWAHGVMDYTGQDSFKNIQSKLDQILTLNSIPPEDLPENSKELILPLVTESEDEKSSVLLQKSLKDFPETSGIAKSIVSSFGITKPTTSMKSVTPSTPLRGILRVRTPEPIPPTPEEKSPEHIPPSSDEKSPEPIPPSSEEKLSEPILSSSNIESPEPITPSFKEKLPEPIPASSEEKSSEPIPLSLEEKSPEPIPPSSEVKLLEPISQSLDEK